MELREALSIAEQVKNRYQAFQKIQEVLTVAVSLEANIQAAEKRLASLEAQEAKVKEDLAMLRQASAELDKTHQSRMISLNEVHTQKERQLEEDHKKRVQDLDENYTKIKEISEKNVEDLKAKTAEAQSTLDAKLQEIKEAEEHFNQLRARLKV